jgi:hypothetical protein
MAAIATPIAAAHPKAPAFTLFDCLDSYIRQLDDQRSDASTIATAIMGASSFACGRDISGRREIGRGQRSRIAIVRVLDARTDWSPPIAAMGVACHGV